HEVLQKLGLKDFTIKLNNRKVLAGIAESLGQSDRLLSMTIALDKLDKIGVEGVERELAERGFPAESIARLQPVLLSEGDAEKKLGLLRAMLAGSETGESGIREIETVLGYLRQLAPEALDFVELDITLARGLNYYTGSILEVKTNEVAMGSIGG